MTDDRSLADDLDRATEADVVGPGTGGSPTGAGTSQPSDPQEAAADPDVVAMLEDLRQDSGDVRADAADAAEEVGTGTDR